MGMFDYIQCEVPLPDGWNPPELQTKDFGCGMVTHIITKDGRLLLEQIDETLDVPKHERPYPDAPEGSLKAFCGCIRTVRSRHDANFHGIVNFYGLETVGREPDERYGARGRPIYKHHNYNAKFTNGQLVEITMADEEAS
jgi:hypothetical protein